jgi:hypothetical protein
VLPPRPRSVPHALVLLTALAGTLAAAAPAAAVSLDDAAAARREQRAIDLINSATREMRRDPACRQRIDFTTTFTDAVPSAAMRASLSLLRRPAIPEDLITQDSGPGLEFLGAHGVYRNWIRMGRAADGSEHYLIVAQDRRFAQPVSRACLRTRHAALVRMTAGEDRRVRTIALRTEARINREEQSAGGFPRHEVIYLFGRAPDGSVGGGGGGVELAWFLRHGLFGTASRGSGDTAEVTGLIPDGVATIEATFAQRASRGPHRAPDLYPSELTLTLPVQDNLVAFTVPREARDAFPSKMVWRAADGSIVRTVRERR